MCDNHRTMQMPLLALGATLTLLTVAPASAPSRDGAPGAGMLGRPAPAWSFERWIRSVPLSPEALRGRVVLLRWWTDGCHYCAATLPALEPLQKRHAREGLVVIGVYHPKPPRAVSDRRILEVADQLGFSGPIAVDRDWSTLERYWLAGHLSRGWTSVSFLIDRAGKIRWLHKGGEYHPSSDPRHADCSLEYAGLEQALAAVLAEPAPARATQ